MSSSQTSNPTGLSKENQKFFEYVTQLLFSLAIATNRPPWMKELVDQIQAEVLAHRDWIGIPAGRKSISGAYEQKKDTIRLLDYACGSGELSRTLLPYVDQTRGIDLSAGMVKAYNEVASNADLLSDKIFAVQGDILGPSADVDNGASFTGREWFDFDIAAMSMALHHVASPEGAVKKLVGRLKEGGRVFFIDWLSDSINFHGAGHSEHGPGGDGRDPGSQGQHFATPGHAHAHNVVPGSEQTITRAGFGREEMLRMLEDAGCVEVDFKLFDKKTRLGDSDQAVMQRMFLVKGKKA
ncbi:MAG: hypothetical protein Q9181_004934 [Wetmoreana brouardii]